MIPVKPPNLWIDASNCRDGGGITHLLEVVPRLAEYWPRGKITVFAAKNERQLLRRRSETIKLPEIPDLDEGLSKRLRWQKYGYPKLIQDESRGGIAYAPGGILTASFQKDIATVTMCRNMLPFEAREAIRYGFSRMLLRLSLLRRGQFQSFRRANGVIFISKYAEKRVGSILPDGVCSTTIPHGIGDEFRHPPEDERILQTPRRLLYVSIIDVYKHQHKVVEALNILVSRGHDLTLDLVGGEYPPARQRLDRAINRTGQQDRVNVRGKIDHGELPGIYRGGDIFIFASSCENLPNILLEAMASGLPIACSDRGPMGEISQDSAIYFDPENPTSIADAVEKLIEGPELRKRCANRAFEIAAEYSWERCARQTFEFLIEARSRKQAEPVTNT